MTRLRKTHHGHPCEGRDRFVQVVSLCAAIFLLSPLPLSSQSIHQIQYNQHLSSLKQAPLPEVEQIIPVPIRAVKNNQLSHTVFGFLPDWEYPTARNQLQYELLTHIACFDFTASANGSIANPSYWPWNDVINEAHTHGVKVIMTLVNFTTQQIQAFLSIESLKNTLFDNIRNIIQQYDLQGVNVDFENLNSADRGALLNRFMTDLTTFMHREIPGSEVSFDGPPVNWGGWELAGLAQACDYIFIMGYNYYGSWSEQTGPCAPLVGGSINLTKTLEQDYASVIATDPTKLILGLPYYGNHWRTTSSSAYANTLEHISHPSYATAYVLALEHGLKWDSRSQTSWCHYKSGREHHQIWFDTDTSLALKYELVKQHNLLGTGMWALGYDDDRPELWNELRRQFTSSSIDGFTNHLPDNTFNIYPNPAWDQITVTTKDPFHLPGLLHLYNIHGQKIKEINLNTKTQIVHLNMLPAGIYFITFHDTKTKLVLL